MHERHSPNMDKQFSIAGYLLLKCTDGGPLEVRLRMLCTAMANSVSAEEHKRRVRPFAADTEFMHKIAGWMNELPEALTCQHQGFADWLELFMATDEAESTRYVMRLHTWYTHFCCVEELLVMCRLLQRYRLTHLEGVCNRITRSTVLQAEELLGIHTDHSFVEKVLACHAKARTAGELAELCGAHSTVTFRRTFLRLFGCPVAQWLRQKRAEQILELLRTTRLPLQEIAEQCGLANQSYLSDFCKRNLGDTPANLRKYRN